jgi:hypothetical protein
MPALPKFLVLLAIFLLARSGDALMNLSSAAGDLVPVNHLIQFVEPMSKPTNKPTVKLTNEHRYENYLQPLCFSDEPTSGSTNNNANNASELININWWVPATIKNQSELETVLPLNLNAMSYQTIMPQKSGL